MTELLKILDYYEYLVTLSNSQSLLSIGVMIQRMMFEKEEPPTEDELSDIKYDLETECNIINIEQEVNALTYKQYLRSKSLDNLLED